MQNPDEEMVVIAFPGEQKAEEVLQTLRQLNSTHLVDLHKAAILVRDAQGKITTHESNDFTTKQGVLGGALAGGLVGILKGNALEGALLGAGAGFLAGKVIDLGFKDSWLQEIAQALTPGSSAIVAALNFEHVDEAMRVLDQFSGGKILRQTLPPDIAQKLAAAVED
jgi:uncharacterized membrane protein